MPSEWARKRAESWGGSGGSVIAEYDRFTIVHRDGGMMGGFHYALYSLTKLNGFIECAGAGREDYYYQSFRAFEETVAALMSAMAGDLRENPCESLGRP